MGEEISFNQLLREKRYVEALNLANRTEHVGKLENNPAEILRGKVYLAIVYTHQKNYKKSKALFDICFKEIVDKLSGNWNGREMIQTYLAYSEPEKALVYLDKYLDVYPENAEVLYQKATILIKLGSYEKSQRLLAALFRNHPNHAGICYSLALTNLHLQQEQISFNYFEKALELGKDEAINDIFALLFDRVGSCDYQQCKVCCCHNQVLAGTDGNTVRCADDLSRLIKHDQRNACWRQNGETLQGAWIFTCNNLLTDNACADYENRPRICRDYPSNLLNLRQGCSYTFSFRKDIPYFTSASILTVVLEILKAGDYISEHAELIRLNGTLT